MKGTIVCDLDGVVYRGSRAIEGAGEALYRAADRGYQILFATNNSARSPADVAAKLRKVAGFEARTDQVVTSAEVAVGLVEEGPVLVVGESGIRDALTRVGLAITPDPGEARTVMVGLDRELHYRKVAAAAEAVRRGAGFIATNLDPTFPTEEGLLPGAGACVAAVEVAAGARAVAAGKPSAAMRAHLEARAGPGPIWMIGDRPDTDLALAEPPRWRRILVLTGVTGDPAGVTPEPDFVTPGLPEAVARILTEDG